MNGAASADALPSSIDATSGLDVEDVLDRVSDEFYAYDPDGRLVRLNRAARDLCARVGLDPDAALGRRFTEVFPNLAGTPVHLAMQRCARERVPVTIEHAGPHSMRWVETRFYPTTAGIAVYVRDVTGRRRAEQGQQLLADAGAALGSSLELDQPLGAVADLVVPAVADWFSLELYDEHGVLRPVITKHGDPGKRDDSNGGRPPEAQITVPLVARDRHFGALSLVATQSVRQYDDQDLRLAEALARRIAVAIDNARLFAETRAAVDRTVRLQAVTAGLARALSPEDVADTVVREGLAAYQARDGILCLLSDDGEWLQIVRADGLPEGTARQFERFRLNAPYPLSDAVRQREPLFFENKAAIQARYPELRDANQRALTESWIALPLLAEDRPIGGVAFGFADARSFSDADRAFGIALAQQCVLALERARLFAAEQRARAAAERLQTLAAALSGAQTPVAVGEVVMRHGVTAVGPWAGVLALVTPDERELELMTSVGYPTDACMGVGRRWSRLASIPIAEATRTGEMVIVESPDAWGRRYLGGRAPKSGRSKAWAAVPIQLAGATAGALLWTYAEEHRFSEDERSLMSAVARLCSQALERARSHEAERQARRDAELARERADEANRAKTEFLAVMSHELRTPLNAIAGYAELLDVGVHGPLAPAQRDAIGRIQRNQQHLLGLINDVLNFARIEAGKVQVEIRPLRVDGTVSTIEALVSPQLSAKGHRYRCDLAGASFIAHADEERLQQILLNLVSNAIKFTPNGGEICVGCGGDATQVRISVRDSGPGIPPDKLDRIFEPFVQLESGRTRTHDGAGLGLAISRNLARAMGGDLTVQSTIGEGTTFTLSLPAGV